MIAATVVFLLGAGIGVLGLFEEDMYIVGSVIVFVGVIGMLVRLGDRLRSARGR